MNLYDFMQENPIQTFLLGIFLLTVLSLLFGFLARFSRMVSIRKHGWPPSHCDADGDFKP